jgi:hypothetical protein
MKIPGFNAEASLYKTSGSYQATMYGIAPTTGIVAQHYGRPGGTCPSFQECLRAYASCYYGGSWLACLKYSICEECGVIVA